MTLTRNVLAITLYIFISRFLSAATFTVINNLDTGAPGTLRWCMNQANMIAGQDTIIFNIPGPGVQTIRPTSQFPILVDLSGVIIDGLSQPGSSIGPNPPSSLNLMIEINGSIAGPAHGFWIISQNNTIQGLVVDSFQQHGIRLQGSPNHTANNIIQYNIVGTDPMGIMPRGNGWNQARFWGGIYIEVVTDSVGFAHDNFIDFNLVSCNYAEGVGISSCPPGDVYMNHVRNNYIGTDIGGSIDLGNIHDGVYIGEGAHDNTVDFNLISGNDFEGVCIIGYPPLGWNSYHNIVYNNVIGLDINMIPLPNTHDGVSIGQYGNFYNGGFANDNIIDTNIIAHNGTNGVTVWEHSNSNNNCDRNLITRNSIYNNTGLGIDLGDNGVTVNDAGDPDFGPNEEINFPYSIMARYFNATGQTIIDGLIDIDTPPTQATVEVFRALADPTGYGEGQIFLGATTPNASNFWTITVSGLVIGDQVTATTTDVNNNTSEFSANTTVVLGIQENNQNRIKAVRFYALPNPFYRTTRIFLPAESVQIEIFRADGAHVRTLTGYEQLIWDGKDQTGLIVPAGVYFCRMAANSGNDQIKIIKLR